MTKKIFVAGGIAVVSLLVGGWALAQSAGHGEGGGGMMGTHGRMGPGMHGQMGGRMMGMGPGMMGMNHGSATPEEQSDIHTLLLNNGSIKRTVTNLSDGIRTVTESDDPKMAATIKKHVADMGQRVEQGRDPGLPIESPALKQIFRDKDKIRTKYESTEKGVIVVQTSDDTSTVKALQDHAAEVTDLAQRGMVAAHEAMMKNGGMMGRGKRDAAAEQQHRH